MFQKGERISKYEIRQELGGGYFGTTYRAFDTITQTDVALKVISNLKHFNFESFAREARMLFELNHPNIIKYFESNFFTLRGRKIYYISMEYAQRGTLREVMNTFDTERSTDVLVQILKGLEAIHSKGILHSDLKPDNILIDASNNIKISDFGVAKMGVGTHYFGSPAGSPLYMAPEQFLKGKTSVRTDIWSVGVIYYEMLYKKRPFENIQEIIDRNHHPVYKNGTRMEKLINDFIRICLKRDEEERFQNIRAMIEFLEPGMSSSKEEKNKEPQPVEVSEILSEQGFYNKGVDFALIGDTDSAVAYFDKAVAKNNSFLEAYLNRGIALYEKGLHMDALKDFSAAINIKGDSAEAYFGRANAYTAIGNYDKAVDDYGEALMYHPQDPETYYNRGIAYELMGELDLAIADYSEAIKLKPDFSQAFHNRGICFDAKGEYDMAVGDFTEAMIFKTGFSDAFLGRANAYLHMGDLDRAVADYTQTVALKPDEGSAYFNRGFAHEKTGNLEKAMADYTKAIEVSPDLFDAYVNRGLIYHQQGNIDQAMEDFYKSRRIREKRVGA